MLYNMDCIEGSKKYIKDESIDLIVTDPPYNLGFGGTSMTKSKKPRFSIIANDKLSDRSYQRFTFQWLREANRILKPGHHIYVFIDWRKYPEMVLWMRRCGFVIKNCIVWDKQRMGMGYQYRFRHEFIIFAVKGEGKARRVSTRSSTDIWSIPRIAGNKTVHPTEKPVSLMKDIIINSSLEGETIADFFVGSGPVAVAADELKREIIGFELDSTYFGISNERLKK